MTVINALAPFCDRFDEIRASLRWAKSAMSGSEAERRAAREVNASSFVGASGALEQFVRRFVESLAVGVADSGRPLNQIRLSMHAVVSSDDFRSLQDVKDREKVFRRRFEVLERTDAIDPCVFAVRLDELGLDGETIRPAHVNLIWTLFGLQAPAFANVQQQVAMRVIADNRNDYAHGKVPITQFLQSPECDVDRILVRLDELESWSFHCWKAADHYLSSQGYVR
jgi:hypothetical protein